MDRRLAATEQLDYFVVLDVEGEEADGERVDLRADLGGADVDDDGFDLLLCPLEKAVVRVDDRGGDEG